MGMDSGWFRRFMDAYWDSFSATDLSIWKVVRRNSDRSLRTPITEEMSWDEVEDRSSPAEGGLRACL
jgi:hypothetical protein